MGNAESRRRYVWNAPFGYDDGGGNAARRYLWNAPFGYDKPSFGYRNVAAMENAQQPFYARPDDDDDPVASRILGGLAGYGTMESAAAEAEFERAEQEEIVIAAHVREIARSHREQQDIWGKWEIRRADPYDETPISQRAQETKRLAELEQREKEHRKALRLLGVRLDRKLPFDVHN